MRTQTLNLLILALIVITSSLTSAQDITIRFRTSPGGYKLMSDTTLTPAEIHTYTYAKYAQDTLSEADCESLGQQLIDYSGSAMDLATARKLNIEQRWVYLSADPNSTAYFNVDPTSKAFVFNKSLDDGFTENSDTPALPSDLQASDLALAHLAEIGLLPTDETLYIRRVGGVGMAMLNEDGSTVEYEKLRTVVFGRRLHGLEVKGSSRIVMQMGTDGDMVGLIYNWPAIQKQAAVTRDILHGLHLQARVSTKLQALYRGSNLNMIDIWEMEQVMYDDGAGTIEPALLAKGQTYLQDGTQDDGDWIIPCLKRPRALYAIDQRPAVAPDVMETEPQNQTDEDDE